MQQWMSQYALLVGTACRIVKLKCIELAKDTNNKKYTMKMIHTYIHTYIYIYMHVCMQFMYWILNSQETMTVWTNSDKVYPPTGSPQLRFICAQGRDPGTIWYIIKQVHFHRNIAASSLAADCNVPQRPPSKSRSFTSIQMVHTHEMTTYLFMYYLFVHLFVYVFIYSSIYLLFIHSKLNTHK